MMSTHTENRVTRMSVFQTYNFAFHREFPKESWEKEVLFRVLKKLVIKSDFQNVRFGNRVRIELTVIFVWVVGNSWFGV